METLMISKSLLCFLSACNLNWRANTNTHKTHTHGQRLFLLAFSHTNYLLAIPPTLASKCSGQAIHPSLCVHCWCLHTLDHNHPSQHCFLAGLAKIKRSCSPKMANTTNATLTALRMLVGVSLTIVAMAQNAGESTCPT